MNNKTRKVCEFAIAIIIVGLSIVIFIYRDELQNISDVSYLGLILLCFLANATVFLPAPSLMIAASCALIMNPLLVSVCAAFGSTLGEVVGYLFGTMTKDLSPQFRQLLDRISSVIRNDIILVFVFAALPLPLFDFVGVYSGGAKLNIIKFSVACFAGKLIKMLIYTHLVDIMSWFPMNTIELGEF